MSNFLGLRTVTYHTPDLAKGKAWYAQVFGVQPYFDMPFYVGFNIGGYELGLVPDGESGTGGHTAYWGVADIQAAWENLLANGATVKEEPNDVGEGIKVGSVFDPFGNVLAIIENPHFELSKD